MFTDCSPKAIVPGLTASDGWPPEAAEHADRAAKKIGQISLPMLENINRFPLKVLGLFPKPDVVARERREVQFNDSLLRGRLWIDHERTCGGLPLVSYGHAHVHTRERAVSRYEELPLSFEVNQGQADPSVKFVSHTSGAAVFLTNTEAVLSLASPAPQKTASPYETTTQHFPQF